MDKYTEELIHSLRDLGRVPVEDRRMKAKFRILLHKMLGKTIFIEDALMTFNWKMNDNNELVMVQDEEK
jgi:hypothetical protein